jgi:hypothetical protein
MRRAVVTLGLLMVTQEAHAKEDQVTVRGLGAVLRLAEARCCAHIDLTHNPDPRRIAL